MIAVVDSSVVIKWFVGEENSDFAADLKFHALAAPDLLLPECANVFWKKARRGEYDIDDAALALRAIEHSNILISPSAGLTGRAFQIAAALDHAAYDCFYLALSEHLAVPMITADGGLCRKVRAAAATSARVLSLTEWSSINAD